MINASDLDTVFDALEIVTYPPFSETITSKCYVPESKSFYSLYQTPYFKPVLEWMEDQNIDVVSAMVSSQTGKSVLSACIATMWASQHANDAVLYYVPDESSALNFANKKLRPIIEQSPYYAGQIKKNLNGSDDRKAITRKSIKLDNGSEVRVLGVGSRTAMVSLTASLCVVDEFSSMGKSQTDRGSILELAKTRMASKSHQNRKLLVVSTPRRPEEDIHKLWMESRQYQWHVPCPHCQTFQNLDFANLKRPDRPDGVSYLEFADAIISKRVPVWYECPHCKGRIEEEHKPDMLNAGRLVCTGNDHLSMSQVSLHVNGMASLEKWSVIMAKFLRSIGDARRLEEFQTQTLASPFEVATATRKILSSDFTRSEYPRGIYPEDTIKVVAGIDVQGDRFYWTLLAYTRKKQVHLVEWGETKYQAHDLFNPESWVYQLQEQKFGDSGLEIDMAVIDSGFNTHDVVALCQDLPRAQAVKGQATRSYTGQYLVKRQSQDILFCPIQESNELFQSLVSSKAFLVPYNIDDKDEMWTHIHNVVFRNGKYEDKFKGSQNHVDWRDCIRYALSWIYYCDFSSIVDNEVYVAKAKNGQISYDVQAVSNVFGGF